MILAHSFPVAVTGREVTFNQDIKALVPNVQCDPEFLLYWFESNSDAILAITETANHGTKRLPTERFFGMEMSLPSLEEQKRIAAQVTAVDDRIVAEDVLRTSLKTARSALMSALLTGELRVRPDESSEAAA
jgi:type I restriction enzyme S subunit